jgi:WhiB family redox-sensing transcriptional regulator
MTENKIEHHKSRKKCPPVSELAPLVRSGVHIADVARQHGISPSTLKQNFRKAGLSAETGLPPTPQKPMAPRPAEAKFEYSAGDMRGEGACYGDDHPEFWFPEDMPGKRATQAATEYAKRVCKGCDMKPECLAFALKTDEAFGIGGALTADERRALVEEKSA